MVNYILTTVLVLSLQQDFDVPEQQDFPQPFLCLALPLSAKLTPVTSKTAVASKNTFFIIMIFYVINQRKTKVEIAECQF
jgi:hypothetical protein